MLELRSFAVRTKSLESRGARIRGMRLAGGASLLLTLALGRPATAQPALPRDACLSDPKCADLNQAASNLAQTGQLDAALALYQTAYAQHPVPSLLVSIGQLQQKLGRLSAAINSYRQYLASLETINDPVLTQKVRDYLAQAQASVTDVCLTDPKCAELNETARNLSKAGQMDAALTLYQTAYAQRPASWLLVNIGRTQQKLGRLPAAIANYRQYLASSEAKDDPELTKKVQEYLFQAEADFEPDPQPLILEPPPPPPPPSSDTPDPSGATWRKGSEQKRRGFAVGLGLHTRMPVVQLDGATTAQASSIGGSLFLGAKLNRVVLGIGLELDRFATTTMLASAAGESAVTQETTSFLIAPLLQVALLRTAGSRLELYAAAQVGLGRAVGGVTRTPEPSLLAGSEVPSSTFHVNYQLGPGLRFYVIPKLAVTLLSGLAGDHFFATKDSAAGLRADAVSSLSLFGTLGLLGVF